MIRIRILHDFFFIRGGAENVVIEFQKTFCGQYKTLVEVSCKAPKISSLRSIKKTRTFIYPRQCYKSNNLNNLYSFYYFLYRSKRADSTDICIYSGIYAPLASLRAKAKRKIYYCHTPPRFLCDLKKYYVNQQSRWIGLFLSAFTAVYHPLYARSLGRMDLILTNSSNTRQRLLDCFGYSSTIVYPPTDVNLFTWKKAGNYYLSTARLEDFKRVENIVLAFMQMPDKELVIASSGSQEQKLRRLAVNHNNIHFTGWCAREKLIELIERSIATIYIPINEDFGMSPVESMAAGKPVIGVDEGGLKETIIDNETGVLLPREASPEQLANAIRYLSVDRAHQMRTACEVQAGKFDIQIFRDRIKHLISEGIG